ncbi:hypothetical protein PGB90_005187 [Kerria lacca]
MFLALSVTAATTNKLGYTARTFSWMILFKLKAVEVTSDEELIQNNKLSSVLS